MPNQGGVNLSGLITATPYEGRQLAIKLARKLISGNQPDKELREQLTQGCAFNPSHAAAASGNATYCKTCARNMFQEIAKANNYWRKK
ncbi:hypothetical protein I2I11_12655 [Pontibacter sp. 172403-2]|uniref:hexameric tyrosine-coordinated heme protein n=1 Tax=Pontibacter rufus TaxID=2791028 RepID=UPI0018AFA861|nr:hexameric tyrosine-coordinated heme protein [Pontibacter sp. 172403-2]MBF9254147.1 hypothetical protein [Pontibacter sp. 172403-2]